MSDVQKILDDSAAQIVARVHDRNVTRAELSAAFDRVRPAGHWKNAIDATAILDTDFDVAMVREAVVFFTGSVPDIECLSGVARRFRVRAAGYFATIGA